MREKFILSADQGTTSSRAIIFNHSGTLCASARKEFTQIYPQQGWVEHDPVELWTSQMEVCKLALSELSLNACDIAAMGIANQRETTVVWHKKTGKPVYNAIVWQDRRTARACEQLKKDGQTASIRNKTGLEVDPYFSATKVQWILDHIPGARDLANSGHLAFGTIDSWLIWNLTGGKQHVTDASNASRTMLFNIHTLNWDKDLLELFNIPGSMLPEVVDSSGFIGSTQSGIFDEPIAISGIAGDQQASLFGQMCFEEGKIKNTYGTGCFLMLSTGKKASASDNKLITTIAWQLNGSTHYALEGSVFVAGAVVQWMRDELQLIESSSEIEALAQTVPDNGGVCFVPAFTGLGAPWWNSEVRGMITGLTRGTRKGHLARAALESIAFQNYFVIQSMLKDSGKTISCIRADGGAASNNLLMQIQADVLGIRIERSRILENTACGAAYLAGLAVGYWNNLNEIKNLWEPGKVFEPRKSMDTYEMSIRTWENAVKMAISCGQ